MKTKNGNVSYIPDFSYLSDTLLKSSLIAQYFLEDTALKVSIMILFNLKVLTVTKSFKIKIPGGYLSQKSVIFLKLR